MRRGPVEAQTSAGNTNKTLLGLIALVVVAVIVATMLLFEAVAPGYRQYTAQFAQAAALKVSNAVTIAGVPVGQVTNLKLAGNHVEARFRSRTTSSSAGLQGQHLDADHSRRSLPIVEPRRFGLRSEQYVRHGPTEGAL